MKATVLSCLLLFSTSLLAQKGTVKEAFLEKWENSSAYLWEVAEAMPEDFYDFKPTEREMSFKEQLLHIKENMDWLSTTYFSEEPYEKETVAPAISKEEVLQLLNTAFKTSSERIQNTSEEELSEIVDFFAGPKSKLQILNLLQDHVTHHRGQLLVYLNLKGIAPPKYVGW